MKCIGSQSQCSLRDLFNVLLSMARSVLGTQSEAISGALEQSGDSEMVIGAHEVACDERAFIIVIFVIIIIVVLAFILQSKAQQLAKRLFWRLPLDQSCVTHCSADDHSGLTWH